jgi:hypothetical protein
MTNYSSALDMPAQRALTLCSQVPEVKKDILVRFQQTDLEVRWAWTKTEDAMRFVSQRKNVLVEALRGCARQNQYFGRYTAYLLGQLSDQEFEDISNQFAVAETKADAVLEEKIATLVNDTQTSFQTDQLAFMFSAPYGQVQRVEKRLAAQNKLLLKR